MSREDRPLLSRLPVELVVLPVGGVRLHPAARRNQAGARGGSIDPLVLLAPTLLLFAASFLALRLLLFAFRRMDGRIGARDASRPTWRGASSVAPPGRASPRRSSLLLAMGLLVVSTSYRAIVLTNHADAAHAIVGADWNVGCLAARRCVERGRAHAGPDHAGDPHRTGYPQRLVRPAADRAGDRSGDVRAGRVVAVRLLGLIPGRHPPEPPDGAYGHRTPPGRANPHPHARRSEGRGRDRRLATVLDANDDAHTPTPQPVSAGTATYQISLAPGARLLSITFQAATTLNLPFRFPIGIDGVTSTARRSRSTAGSPSRGAAAPARSPPTAAGTTSHVQIGAGAGDRRTRSPDPAAMPALLSTSVARQAGDRLHGDARRPADRAAPAWRPPTSSRASSRTPRSSWSRPRACSNASSRFPSPASRSTRCGRWVPLSPAGAPTGRVHPRTSSSGPSPSKDALAQLPQSLAVGMNFTAAAGGSVWS